MDISSVKHYVEKAKSASTLLATVSTEAKNEALRIAGQLILARVDELMSANEKDVAASKSQVTASVLDRLKLSERRIRSMVDGLDSVISLPDPIGDIVEGWVRPNGLRVSKVRVPLGVIGIIYENRPNVTSDAAALCVKAGNAVVLRGSASAYNSNLVIATALKDGLAEVGLPENAVILLPHTDHEAVKELVGLNGLLDCVIPRGGPGLLQVIVENARVPVVIDGDGNCHVYIDESADIEMAISIVMNAKVQRPSVCNAMETLLVHKMIAKQVLPVLGDRLREANVELVGDEKTRALLPEVEVATEEDYATEFLDLKLAIKVVDTIEDAISHVRKFSTGHSEAIVTSTLGNADRWVNEIDAAAVLVNASTRFIDGGELGLGAEIGISTQKLHARGPMGLKELTCAKFVVRGEGQIRK
ncbi:MAG: glutamate-5-semialdehyde dehydrogenase [Acidimicrobiales bacterium]|nr:glutamate-5-semialdehyde dehydrogenase [Acidimicrobiales bacterium]